MGEFVVSHFDADHWAGLRALAERLVPGDLRSEVDLIYPRTPDRSLDPGVLALALDATRAGTGVRSLDLRHALDRVTTPNPIPVSTGDKFFAAGRQWEVLWPPRRLTTALRAGLISAGERMERLADDMKSEGFPELRANLDLAREVGFSVAGASSDQGESAYQELELRADEDVRHLADGEDTDDQAGSLHGEPLELGRIPRAFRDRFREASRVVAEANNDLSLVFHDVDHQCSPSCDGQGRPEGLWSKNSHIGDRWVRVTRFRCGSLIAR